MKVGVPDLSISETRVQQVSVGEIKIGELKIDNFLLSQVKVKTSTGIAQLRNVMLTLHLQFGLDWSVGIKISMPNPFSGTDIARSGTLDLGALRLGVGFGNLTLPGFANFAFDIPSLSVNDVSAVVGSIKDLKLGAVIAERMRAQNVVAPTEGFQINGIGIDTFSAKGIGIPSAALGGATIDRVTGGALPISSIAVPNFALPQAAIPTLSSHHVDATSNPVIAKLPKADNALLSATLKVTATAAVHVDELRIENIHASASVGEIVLKNLSLPYEFLNLTLSQIGIETIEIPQLEVK
jgi:hypothetical protein